MSPADFVTDWNATDETRAIAEALLASQNGTTYDPFLLGTIAVLGSISLGVATNAIYNLIKRIIVNCGFDKRILISRVDRPDGTHILVVDIEEK